MQMNTSDRTVRASNNRSE